MVGFGGFGGYAFPTRRVMDAPQSAQVLSDQEFSKTWQEKLPSQYLTGSRQVQLVAGNSDYSQGKAQQFVAPIREQQRSQFAQAASGAGWDQNWIDTNWQASLNMGYVPGIGADGGIILNPDTYTTNLQSVGRIAQDNMPGGAGVQYAEESYSYANPEWDKAKAAMDAAMSQRNENTIRQQQAYDTYLAGDGQIGGVMGEQYRNPAFGQVSGQKQGDVLTGMPGVGTGFGGITGVDDTSQTGAYAGGAGKYNPNPFAPGSFRNANPWA